MPSFQAKIGLKRPRKRENNSYRSVPFRSYPTRNREGREGEKILKNAIMASFQVKTGWKRPRRRKNKYYRTILFLPEAK